MAEQGGFFRRIFSFGQKPEPHPGGTQPDVDRRAEAEDLVAAPDIATKAPEAPDNDAHQLAAASSNADTEAGADPRASDEGGIEPLHPASPPHDGGSAEKKTPNS